MKQFLLARAIVCQLKRPDLIKSIPVKTTLKTLISALCLFGLWHLSYAAGPDPSTDMLTAVKTDVTSNIGPGSTFAWVLYVVEIIGGVAAYMKTKNMLALVGIVVVLIFTTAAFSIIGS